MVSVEHTTHTCERDGAGYESVWEYSVGLTMGWSNEQNIMHLVDGVQLN